MSAAFAEFGDKTQLLVIAFVLRFRKPLPVLAGVAAGALANGLLAGWAGTLVHDLITLRSTSLLVAVALLFAGVAGFMRPKTPDMGGTWKTGAFLTTAGCVFLLELADKTQFLTAAIAAQYDSLVLAALGATVGVVVANAPAALLGDRMETLLPMTPLRMGIACLFLLAGFFVTISAMRLV